MRWQRQHWSTEDFDFTEDAEQWADPDLLTEEERRFLLFGFSQFFLGEERVTVELLPFALGAPSHEAQVFLTTQISDEAKHMVFFDRFYREVFGMKADSIGDMLGQQRNAVNEDWETLFDGILHECAENLRKDPSDFASLVRGITVYMVVIEGTLALTGARFMISSRSRSATGSPASRPASPRSTATSPATSASASSSWRTRSRPTRPTRGSSRRR